eukprot:SAG31_NODE_328_length_17643_cov_46.707649_10_plen_149_part_00
MNHRNIGIGEWMWKHEVGLTPTAPAFAEVRIAPKVHNAFGPASTDGTFLSPRGEIRSAWRLSHAAISLNVSLPVGVGRATVVVPKPFDGSGQRVDRSVVVLNGKKAWDGENLVDRGAHKGVMSAVDEPNGVIFNVLNGEYTFEATPRA